MKRLRWLLLVAIVAVAFVHYRSHAAPSAREVESALRHRSGRSVRAGAVRRGRAPDAGDDPQEPGEHPAQSTIGAQAYYVGLRSLATQRRGAACGGRRRGAGIGNQDFRLESLGADQQLASFAGGAVVDIASQTAAGPSA